MEWAILPFLTSRSASPHFGRYSFPVPQRVGAELAWVAGYIPRWYARPKTIRNLGINRLGVAQRRSYDQDGRTHTSKLI